MKMCVRVCVCFTKKIALTFVLALMSRFCNPRQKLVASHDVPVLSSNQMPSLLGGLCLKIFALRAAAERYYAVESDMFLH